MNLAADHLMIEVTEHLDDFGTGYSSLSRLHEFPIDAIKIDKSFVMSADEKSLAVIEGALLIAKKFGLKVIEEGVESAQQREKLLTLGVDELQGYFFGKPSEIAKLSVTEIRPTHLSGN
ncbi:MAG: EAL domain-containing protein [Burkholderiaceae bacterium]|nr:EAL domain-containing protein [Burkholderiaceae bacterium]